MADIGCQVFRREVDHVGAEVGQTQKEIRAIQPDQLRGLAGRKPAQFKKFYGHGHFGLTLELGGSFLQRIGQRAGVFEVKRASHRNFFRLDGFRGSSTEETSLEAALAAGADGLFIETHPDPANAISDGPNMIPLDELPRLLAQCLAVWQTVRG